MYIALNLEERARVINDDEVARVAKSLFSLEREIERTEFYVGLLPLHLRETIRLHYFDGHPWKEVADAEKTTIKAVHKRRTVAVEMIADFLLFILFGDSF